MRSRDQRAFEVVQASGPGRRKEADRFLDQRCRKWRESVASQTCVPRGEVYDTICHRPLPQEETRALSSLLLAEQLLRALVSAPSHARCEWEDGAWSRGGQDETLNDTLDGGSAQAPNVAGVRNTRETRSFACQDIMKESRLVHTFSKSDEHLSPPLSCISCTGTSSHVALRLSRGSSSRFHLVSICYVLQREAVL